MRIIDEEQFDSYWKNLSKSGEDPRLEKAVRDIIADIRSEGDAALFRYTERFDRCLPRQFEVSPEKVLAAWEDLRGREPRLAAALELSADHIRRFASIQRSQFTDFETEMSPGLFTGQKVIPVERAAVYAPAGRFPLFSSVLMGMIPALVAGVDELILASPPTEDGFPDRYILAAAALASGLPSVEKDPGRRQTNVRVFAIGGAQAIAALALGTETVPKAGIIVGPGNKYVAAAKRMLFGEVGIDFVAGPTDVLVITGDKPSSRLPAGPGGTDTAAALAAADMLAQAEHDPDARARALVPNRVMAENVAAALELGLERLVEQRGAAAVAAETAGASLEAGGLIVVYHSKEAAIRIANKIAPEHLELQMENTEDWIPALKNYGSLFIGGRSAEVLGDYSAGINHTLPTSGSARFSGGLSVRHFLKTVTTLRCDAGNGFEKARKAAEIMGTAEGLAFHAQSAALRGDRTL